MRQFSMGEAWNEAIAILKQNWLLYAGVTIATLIISYGITYLLNPETFSQILNPLNAQKNVGWMQGQSISESISSSISSIIGSIPALFIWRHALARGADAQSSLVYAAIAAIPYMIGFFLMLIPVVIGLILLIIPGLYLYARLGLFGPIMAANNSYNMMEAIGKSWEMTRENGFAIVLYYFILGIIYIMLMGLGMALIGFGFFNSGANIETIGTASIILLVTVGFPLFLFVSLISSVVPAGIYRALAQDNDMADVFA